MNKRGDVKLNWANLTKQERAEYMRIQMSHGSGGYGGGGYLPDDCSVCQCCEQPMLGSGLCHYCYIRWRELRDKLEERGVPTSTFDDMPDDVDEYYNNRAEEMWR